MLPKEVKVTRRSILEYAQALRSRYFGATREEKGKMLDEFTLVTGLHRKAAIRLLHRLRHPGAGKRRGRPRKYGTGVAEVLRVVWEASDRLCSKRLQPFAGFPDSYERLQYILVHGRTAMPFVSPGSIWPI